MEVDDHFWAAANAKIVEGKWRKIYLLNECRKDVQNSSKVSS